MNLIHMLKTATYPATGTPVIACFGDSVTHGAFECLDCEGANCIFDFDSVYHARLRRKLMEVNSWLPVSIINAGVAGAGKALVFLMNEFDTRIFGGVIFGDLVGIICGAIIY
mgnify:CR=1 FL=1